MLYRFLGNISMPKQPCVGKTLLAVLLMALCLLALSAQSSLWDRDEARFARSACEMLQSGNWLLPTLNSKVYAHKPPFAFWAMAGSMALFGVNSVAARLPAVLSLAASGWLVFLMGRLLFSPMVGFWACVMLMSSAMAMVLGSIAMVDGPLLAFVSLAMYAHLKVLHQPKKWYGYWPVLGLSLGLSGLTKHPVGMATVVPAVICSTWLLQRDLRIPKTYWFGLFLAFLAGYALHQAWFIPVCNVAPGFGEVNLGRQVVGRFFAPMEGHGAESLPGYLALLPFYIPTILIGFAPWSAFLPAGVWALARRRLGSRTARVFLISWMLPVFVLFSLAATKLPHYIFPIFPPLALITASLLDSWRKGLLDQKEYYWLQTGVWIYSSVVLALGVGLCLISIWLRQEEMWWGSGALVGVLISASGLLGFHLIRSKKMEKAARLFLVGMPLFMLLSVRYMLPSIEPLIKVSPVLGEVIRADRLSNEPVAMCGYMEPSFYFYLNLPANQAVATIDQFPEALHAWATDAGPGWLVVYDSLWEKMLNRFGPVERARSRIIVPLFNMNDRAKRDSVRVVQRLPQPTYQPAT